MKLQVKILILLIISIGAIILSVIVNQFLGRQQNQFIHAEYRKDLQRIVNHALHTGFEKSNRLTKDYSGWDDMVRFIEKTDRSWATDNIDPLVLDYGFSFSLLYTADKVLHYAVYDSISMAGRLSLKSGIIESAFGQAPYCHFFQYFGPDLYEISGAVVVPGFDFVERRTVPAGYLINARRVDPSYLKELEEATTFKIKLIKAKTIQANPAQSDLDYIFTTFNLSDHMKNTIAYIEFTKENKIAWGIERFTTYSILLSLLTFLILLIFVLALRNMVISPVAKILKALSESKGKPLEPLLMKNDEFQKIAGILMENFENKKMLKDGNLVMSKVIEQSPVTIVVADVNGNIEYTNPAFTRVTGYTQEDALGRNPRLLNSGQVPAETFHNLWQTIREGNTWAGELINKKKNGEIYYEEAIISPVKNGNEQITHYIAIKNDITLRKQQEESNKLSEANLNALINNRGESIWSIDKEYRFIIFNEFFKNEYLKAFNIELEKGMSALTILTPELLAFWKPKYTNALKGERINFEFSYPIENKLSYYEVSLNPIVSDNNITGLSAISRNITSRKEAEMALAKRESELRALNATKDKLFSIIGHDLRGPVAGLKSLVEMLMNNFDLSDTQGLIRILRAMETTTDSSYNLLENLLSWAKSQQNEIVFEPKTINLYELVNTCIGVYSDLANSKAITIQNLVPTSQVIYADPNLLNTVVRNLISNAIKFTHKSKNICINITEKDTTYSISIKDEGIGIGAEALSKIFNPSENYVTYGTAGEKGSGLGLLLCRDFVEKHGGTIWVESEPGKGSNFIFTLPKMPKLI
jgi:PAS domain S-box-containing protein